MNQKHKKGYEEGYVESNLNLCRTIPAPETGDGEPIEPGMRLYTRDGEKVEVKEVIVTCTWDYRWGPDYKYDVYLCGKSSPVMATYLYHKKPDTLEDIVSDMRHMGGVYLENYLSECSKNIQVDAYEEISSRLWSFAKRIEKVAGMDDDD